MHKALLILIIILSFISNGALAQRRFPPRPGAGAHHPFTRGERKVRVHLAPKAYPNAFTVNFTLGVVGKIFGPSLGAEYERYLDKGGYVSVSIPFILYAGGMVNFDSYGSGDTRSNTYGAYAAPGFRVHPAGNGKRLDPAIGIALAVGGYNRDDTHLNSNGSETRKEYHSALTAVLFELGLNVHSGRHLAFGTFISGGPTLTNKIPGGAMLQVGIKLGNAF